MVKKLSFLFVTGVFLLLLVTAHFTYQIFADNLTTKERIVNHSKGGVILEDVEGKPFFSFYQGKTSEYMLLSRVSRIMQQAVVAAEDEDFYSHHGFSAKGIVRSAYLNMKLKTLSYGGSTITQQLAKNALLSPEKSLIRKYKELVLAYSIEKQYSKEEFLEMYLNTAYFGRGAIGIGEASEVYFNKSPKDLTLPEASYLAGILASPSKLSEPKGDARQAYVLKQMEDLGYITSEEHQKALKKTLTFEKKENPDMNSYAPHFALMIMNQLEKEYGEEYLVNSGFRVRTTLDLEMQKYAEERVKSHINALSYQRVSNGAAVVIDVDSSEVRVLVGSRDWYDEQNGKINMAATPRQVGSAFKPVVYALAFEQGAITPATVLNDRPTTFASNYKPQNYDNRFRGRVLVRRALANSLNVPAVEVMQRVGVEDVLEFSKTVGITTLGTPVDYGPSLVLGTGAVPLVEMTNVYATFANRGEHNDIVMVKKITNKYGDVIFENEPNPTEALSPEVSYLITSILSDRNARREVFGSALDVSRPAAVKTGTTERFVDSWTIGYTPDYSIGVWVGNSDNKPMYNVAGSLGAAPLWRDFIHFYHKDIAAREFKKPETLVAARVCGFTGSVATPSAFMSTEYFIKGTEPKTNCKFPRPKREEQVEIAQQPPSPSQTPPPESTPTPETSIQIGIGGDAPGSEEIRRQIEEEIKRTIEKELKKDKEDKKE